MILPQSSAFVSLRARLMAVHSGGYIPTQAKALVPTLYCSLYLLTPLRSTFTSAAGTARSKLAGKEEIKWQELLSRMTTGLTDGGRVLT